MTYLHIYAWAGLCKWGRQISSVTLPIFQKPCFPPHQEYIASTELTHLPLISINVNIVVFMQAVFAYKRLDI